MFVQILSTSTIRHVWKTLRSICILILGLERLKETYFSILPRGDLRCAVQSGSNFASVDEYLHCDHSNETIKQTLPVLLLSLGTVSDSTITQA